MGIILTQLEVANQTEISSRSMIRLLKVRVALLDLPVACGHAANSPHHNACSMDMKRASHERMSQVILSSPHSLED